MSIQQLAMELGRDDLQGQGHRQEEQNGGPKIPFFSYGDQLEVMTRRQMGVTRSPHEVGTTVTDNDPGAILFDQFCTANTFQNIMGLFEQICDLTGERPRDHEVFYTRLRHKLTSWKAQSLWAKLDKRANQREYKKGTACKNTRVFIIGAGPCGLRVATEVALLGGKAVVVEKRDRFSRNNVLHLWPYLIHDLKALGAKKFFGKFCAGAIDHISIRALQCILLKVALLMGVEVHPGVGFEGLVEPPPAEENIDGVGWKASVMPTDHPVSEFEFDVLIGADGKRNTLQEFRRKEFRGKLAIAITANFINRNTQAEARVEEISGVAFIFNQKFFKDLNSQTGIDLENIVYYKDDTHYFVMTAKKHSLLLKGVLIQDYEDPARLLAKENVDQDALLAYALEAADVSTRQQLPNLEFAHNHYGQPDVAMFDFTSMFAAEHASRVIERGGQKLLVALVGDSLLEPFWPTGSGCARGFLGCLDTGWMIRSWASGLMTPLEVMAERESVYQLLSQTTPENISKNFVGYTVDPNSRYPNLNPAFYKPHQVKSQFDGSDMAYLNQIVQIAEQKSNRYEVMRDSHNLVKWFQKELENYRNIVKVLDLTQSWTSGLALCSLIHKYRPELIDVYSLDMSKFAENNQLAFNVAERELGIRAVCAGGEMAGANQPDKLLMASYLSQFYEYFRRESIKPAKIARPLPKMRGKPRSPGSKLAMLNKLGSKIRQRREEFEKENDDNLTKPYFAHGAAKRRVKEMDIAEPPSAMIKGYKKLEGLLPEEPESKVQRMRRDMKNLKAGVRGQNKVSALAKDLADKFCGKESNPVESEEKKNLPKPKPLIPTQAKDSDMCYFCDKTVYLVERHTAEGLFFHRGCFRCEYCGSNLRIGGYSCLRTPGGDLKFYCHQHYGMKRPFRRPRKRSFGEKDIPPGIVAETGKVLSPALGVLGSCEIDGGAVTRTPERIEYMTESEQEESELEQTQHNLSATLLELDDSQSESTDEELQFEDGSLSEGEVSLLELAKSYSKKLRKSYQKDKQKKSDRKKGEDDDSGSDTETRTIGASDADYESGSDSGQESDTESMFRKALSTRKRRPSAQSQQEMSGLDRSKEQTSETNREKLLLSPTALKPFGYTSIYKSPPQQTKKEAKPSPTTAAIMKNRMAFFSVVSEPVRIDAQSFLGLRPPPEPPQPEPVVELDEGEATPKASEEEKEASEDEKEKQKKEKKKKRRHHKRSDKRRLTTEVEASMLPGMQEAVPVITVDGGTSGDDDLDRKDEDKEGEGPFRSPEDSEESSTTDTAEEMDSIEDHEISPPEVTRGLPPENPDEDSTSKEAEPLTAEISNEGDSLTPGDECQPRTNTDSNEDNPLLDTGVDEPIETNNIDKTMATEDDQVDLPQTLNQEQAEADIFDEEISVPSSRDKQSDKVEEAWEQLILETEKEQPTAGVTSEESIEHQLPEMPSSEEQDQEKPPRFRSPNKSEDFIPGQNKKKQGLTDSTEVQHLIETVEDHSPDTQPSCSTDSKATDSSDASGTVIASDKDQSDKELLLDKFVLDGVTTDSTNIDDELESPMDMGFISFVREDSRRLATMASEEDIEDDYVNEMIIDNLRKTSVGGFAGEKSVAHVPEELLVSEDVVMEPQTSSEIESELQSASQTKLVNKEMESKSGESSSESDMALVTPTKLESDQVIYSNIESRVEITGKEDIKSDIDTDNFAGMEDEVPMQVTESQEINSAGLDSVQNNDSLDLTLIADDNLADDSVVPNLSVMAEENKRHLEPNDSIFVADINPVSQEITETNASQITELEVEKVENMQDLTAIASENQAEDSVLPDLSSMVEENKQHLEPDDSIFVPHIPVSQEIKDTHDLASAEADPKNMEDLQDLTAIASENLTEDSVLPDLSLLVDENKQHLEPDDSIFVPQFPVSQENKDTNDLESVEVDLKKVEDSHDLTTIAAENLAEDSVLPDLSVLAEGNKHHLEPDDSLFMPTKELDNVAKESLICSEEINATNQSSEIKILEKDIAVESDGKVETKEESKTEVMRDEDMDISEELGGKTTEDLNLTGLVSNNLCDTANFEELSLMVAANKMEVDVGGSLDLTSVVESQSTCDNIKDNKSLPNELAEPHLPQIISEQGKGDTTVESNVEEIPVIKAESVKLVTSTPKQVACEKIKDNKSIPNELAELQSPQSKTEQGKLDTTMEDNLERIPEIKAEAVKLVTSTPKQAPCDKISSTQNPPELDKSQKEVELITKLEKNTQAFLDLSEDHDILDDLDETGSVIRNKFGGSERRAQPKLQRSSSSPISPIAALSPASLDGSPSNLERSSSLQSPEEFGLRRRCMSREDLQADAIKRIDDLLSSLSEPAEKDADMLSDHTDSRMETEEEDDYGEILDTKQIVAFTVDDEEGGEKSFNVDEKYINTRDKRRKKNNKNQTKSPSSDSSFTISTPSDSVASTSSVPELHSNKQSSSESQRVSQNGSGTDESSSKNMKVTSLETGLSLEKLVEINMSSDDLLDDLEIDAANLILDAVQPSTDSQNNLVSSPLSKPITNGVDSSFLSPKESTPFISANSTPGESSLYYTPNSSETGTETKPTLSPYTSPIMAHNANKYDKSLCSDTLSEISDQKSLHSNKSDTISASSTPYSPSKLKDLKWRFFADPPQPVRINHAKIFEDIPSKRTKANNISDQVQASNLKNIDKSLRLNTNLQTVDSGTPTSPTAGVPHKDAVSGEQDVFYTPASSVKSKNLAYTDNGLTPLDNERRLGDGKRRLLPATPTDKSKGTTATEISDLKDELEQTKAAARERARLKSDEELGIQTGKTSSKKRPESAITREKRPQNKEVAAHKRPMSATADMTAGKSDSSTLSSTDLPPSMSDGASDNSGASPNISRKEKKAQKAKKAKEDKENRESSGKKEKKRSFLSLLLPSRSVDKKEKDRPKSPPVDKVSKTKSPPLGKLRPSSPVEKSTNQTASTSGVKLRSKTKSPTPMEQAKEEESQKRVSMYDEFAPLMEDLGGGSRKKKENLAERLHQVAPPPAKAPFTSLRPPTATIDELETESDAGDDKISVRSFQAVTQGMTEDELSRMLKKQQKAVAKRQKEQELKRLRVAQEIQRHLEEVEFKQRQVEEKGISVERALRGEGKEIPNNIEDAEKDESELMQEWFNIVHEKNMLVRYESELMVHARELELEDRQGRLEHQLRDLMALGDQAADRRDEEKKVLQELLEVIEQRDALVKLLEEDRLKEKKQDEDFSQIISCTGLVLSPASYVNKLKLSPSLQNTTITEADR